MMKTMMIIKVTDDQTRNTEVAQNICSVIHSSVYKIKSVQNTIN
jgi:hypothetical protein